MSMRQSQTPLGMALAAAIAERGPITFADYMQIALYHPQGGYYTSAERVRQGWGGDYITSTDLHPLFGAAVGRQVAQIWEWLGRPAPFVVLEDGAGRGHLARDLVAWARDPTGDAPPDFAAALIYRLRDVGPDGPREWVYGDEAAVPDKASLPEEGRAVLTESTIRAPKGVPPRNPPSRVSDGAPHVILSNELVDALPVHVVERTAEGLAEVYVDAAGAPPQLQLVERLGPPSSPAVAGYLDRFGIQGARMPVGWRAEVNLAAEVWLAETAARLAPRGVIITIDYGDTARRLYTADRRRGTLMGYHQHQLSDDPLALTGAQDITAHVNFTALIAAGRAHGLRLAGLTTQREFLLALGIRAAAEELGRARFPLADTERHTDAGQRDYLRRASLMHAVAALTDPHGLGGFRVLVQQRGLPGAGKHLLGMQFDAK
jgi:SAM-dependent MidA family methyltransferase